MTKNTNRKNVKATKNDPAKKKPPGRGAVKNLKKAKRGKTAVYAQAACAALIAVSLAFLLGLLFLFGLMFPLEARIKSAGAGQSLINGVMTGVIAAWFIVSVAVALLFWKKIRANKFSPMALAVITVFTVCLAAAGYWQAITSGQTIFSVFEGKELTFAERFTVGPYPEPKKLKELKQAGYSGVISLLNPLIPFEAPLLAEEEAAGKEIGLKIYNFPMLPWIAENDQLLAEILKFVNENPEKKFYIHCFAGRHRADLVIKIIKNQKVEKYTKPGFLYPSTVGMSTLFTYRKNRIAVGTALTPRDWVDFIMPAEIEELVSVLDLNSPQEKNLVKRDNAFCKKFNLKFTQINPSGKDPEKVVAGLAAYVNKTNRRTFIYRSREDELLAMINEYFRFGTFKSADEKAVAGLLADYCRISPSLYLTAGKPERNIISGLKNEAGFDFIRDIKRDKKTGAISLKKAAGMILKSPGVYLITGFGNEAETSRSATALRYIIYGITGKDARALREKEAVRAITPRVAIVKEEVTEKMASLAGLGFSTIIDLSGESTAICSEREKALKGRSDYIRLDIKGGYFKRISELAGEELALICILASEDNYREIVRTLHETRKHE